MSDVPIARVSCPRQGCSSGCLVNIPVAIIGWILVAEGLLGIVRPHLLLDAVHDWPADVQLCIAVGARIFIGLLLFFAAPTCRLPRFTRVFGVIAFVAGIVIAFIGASRLASMVEWACGQPNWMIQLLYVLATILGALLAYSGSKTTKSDA